MSTLRATNIKGRSNGISPAMPDGVVVTGVTTSTTFSGNVTGVAATFSGDVVIGGTLNYEDVTNIDSLGIITARSHVSIADSILHTGDTDTSIRFPAANTFTVETAGGEAIRVDAGRRLLVGTDSSANYGGITGIFQIDGTTNASLSLKRSSSNNSEPLFVLAKSRGTSDSPTVVNSGDGLGGIRFAGYDGSDYVTQAASIICAVDGTPGSNDMPGRLTFNTTADGASTPSERLRIASDGDVRVGSAFSVGQAGVVTCSTVEARVPNIPQNAQASTYTLVKADAGKHINAGGNVTVNSGIFAIGDCISIFNDTTGDITIIQGSSVTLRLVADTGTGTRTLANYGLAAVLCVGSNEFVVSGGGVS